VLELDEMISNGEKLELITAKQQSRSTPGAGDTHRRMIWTGIMTSLIKIDESKCKNDGVCVAECPARILELAGDPPVPRLLTDQPDVEALCISCGHCVAVCPHGAFDHEASPLSESPKLDRKLNVEAEAMNQLLRSRRSIRCYLDEPVEQEVLEALIRTARYAPSGHNHQPVEWLVLSDKAELQGLVGMVVDWMRVVIVKVPAMAEELHLERIVAAWEAGEDRILRDAPHVIVTHAHKDNRMAPPAATIALASLELVAPTQGLGACWAGFFNTAATLFPPMKAALALPEDHVALGSMMLGKPAYRFRRIPKRKTPSITFRP
jgi:nitroreductase/ferredoxin